jgi:hypothetical protein
MEFTFSHVLLGKTFLSSLVLGKVSRAKTSCTNRAGKVLHRVGFIHEQTHAHVHF